MKKTVHLRLPFNGRYPVTFPFGAKPLSEEMRRQFQKWGVIGHNGVDFGLPDGTTVVASDSGKISQAGENKDFGLSVTIRHSWGVSLYAHLKETKVKINQKVKVGEVIGLSGKSGVASGPHLHFGIKPNNANIHDGYLGFIDPLPYFGGVIE